MPSVIFRWNISNHCPMMKHHTAEDMRLHKHQCKTLKSHSLLNDCSHPYLPVTHYFRTNKLTPWSTVLPEKLVGPQSINSLHFMQPKSSLQHSQESITCPCPKPDQSSPRLPIPLLEDPFWYFRTWEGKWAPYCQYPWIFHVRFLNFFCGLKEFMQ
jgi:hypothetical protein